jgi:hypothetical protein
MTMREKTAKRSLWVPSYLNWDLKARFLRKPNLSAVMRTQFIYSWKFKNDVNVTNVQRLRKKSQLFDKGSKI